MDIPSTTLRSFDSSFSPSDASKFLLNLPSRGLFSSTTISSNPGNLRVYVCEHDTAPPEEQLIKTDQTNILIRSLKLKKNKTDSKSPIRESSRKRAPEKVLDVRAKKAVTVCQSSSPSRHEALNSGTPIREYHNLTVERLRSLLKDRGLSVRGKKDELIIRLRESDN